MKTQKLLAVLSVVLGAALLAPSIASAAPYHHRKPHKVCKVDRHHHRVCHWVR